MTRYRLIAGFCGLAVLMAAGLVYEEIAGLGDDTDVRAAAIPGVTLERIATAAGPRLVVTSLRSDGAAAGGGLRVGDRIDGVDGSAASTVAAVRRAVDRSAGRPIDIRVWRAGYRTEIRVDPRRGG